MSSRDRLVLSALVAAGLLSLASHAGSAGWPEKPVRIIVPSGAGGAIDMQARLLAESFRVRTKQPFLVDNRPGASNLIGTEMVVTSPPDGYTVLLNSTNIAIVQTLFAGRTKFNAIKDLAPVSLVSSTAPVLIAHPSVPARSIPELVALARKKPGMLNHGINNLGSTSHLSAEMFRQMAKVDTSLVPFKSGTFAMTALISGEIDLLFASGPVIVANLASGKVRALAVTSAKRSPTFPDLPTMNSYYPGFESENWYGMFFPVNTPKPIVDAMYALVVESLKEERVRDFMRKGAVDPVGSSPQELGNYLAKEVTLYAQIIKKGNIVLE